MHESVTAVLTCQDQIFLIKRKNQLKAFPGYLSFPGGKVDKEDHDQTPAGRAFSKHSVALINALIREVMEETAYNLENDHENIEVIHYLGEAISPSFNPIRFKNHYFQIELKSVPQAFQLCNHEIDWGQWLSKEEAHALVKTPTSLAVPPTRLVLSLFGEDKDFDMPLDFQLPYNPDTQVPWIEVINGVKQFMPLSCTLPPANRTNCFLIGELLIDPSPKDQEEYTKLKNSLSGFKFSTILITHHHADHHQFANTLAQEMNVPLFMSKETHQYILETTSKDYFANIEVNFLSDGDEIGNYFNDKLNVISVPGHDVGQLALAPRDNSWVLVGDLIQGIGTVVISAPEGDMQSYFHSLEKVIEMNPAAIMPSHGIPLGGVHRLKQTLEHRKAREQQVLELLHKGKDLDVIVDTIYQGLDSKLRRYAVKTVQSHIEKLKKENQISN